MTIKNCEYTYFYIHDHLGSTSMVLDADGNISQSVTYVLYGEIFVEERNGTWNTPYLFNGKELDEETGLYYLQSRYYDRWFAKDRYFKLGVVKIIELKNIKSKKDLWDEVEELQVEILVLSQDIVTSSVGDKYEDDIWQ